MTFLLGWFKITRLQKLITSLLMYVLAINSRKLAKKENAILQNYQDELIIGLIFEIIKKYPEFNNYVPSRSRSDVSQSDTRFVDLSKIDTTMPKLAECGQHTIDSVLTKNCLISSLNGRPCGKQSVINDNQKGQLNNYGFSSKSLLILNAWCRLFETYGENEQHFDDNLNPMIPSLKRSSDK